MLSDRDRAILVFEETHWNHTGSKQNAIFVDLEMKTPRYYQHLNRLIDDADALEEFPQLVHRMMDRREAHVRARSRSASLLGLS